MKGVPGHVVVVPGDALNLAVGTATRLSLPRIRSEARRFPRAIRLGAAVPVSRGPAPLCLLGRRGGGGQGFVPAPPKVPVLAHTFSFRV